MIQPATNQADSLFKQISMKDGIHPKYQDCVVTCGCGNTFNTRSTKAKIAVEVCSKCHPYFTGSVKFVDAAGRVDRFNKRFQGTYGKAKKAAAAPAGDKT
jgi:large subunit ribosomal protein L31